MNKRELIEILDQVDDDFEIRLSHHNGYTNGWSNIDHYKINELNDIGYSSKVVSLDIVKDD